MQDIHELRHNRRFLYHELADLFLSSINYNWCTKQCVRSIEICTAASSMKWQYKEEKPFGKDD